MSKNKFFNKKVLNMMIKENIDNNKKLFLKDNSQTELIFSENDYEGIVSILSKKLEGKTNISLEDIDISIDEYLGSKGYIFDCNIDNKYKKALNCNYYYFGIVELKYYSSATSMDSLLYKVSKVLNDNYARLCKSTKVSNDLVNINIVKDNSTRFKQDNDKTFFRAGFGLSNKNLIMNFNLDETIKLYSTIEMLNK